MNILVTGSNGQLGRCIRDEVNKNDIFPLNLGTSWKFTDIIELDITNAKDVMEYCIANDIHAIVNCAAYTDVNGCETDNGKRIAYNVNNIAVDILAHVAAKLNMKVFIHISTDYVFDGTSSSPYLETDITNPLNVYGDSKLLGEHAIESALKDTKCNYVILRTAWLYSEYGKNFVKTIYNMLADNTKATLRVVDDQIGTPTYARNLAKFIYTLVTDGVFESGIYHFTDNGSTSWFGLASIIKEVVYKSKTSDIKRLELPIVLSKKTENEVAKRPKYSVLSKEKVIKSFGIDLPEWEVGVVECVGNLIAESLK